ncbi:hypothetical protein Sjap_023307 [Stephania japonica]|uniref:SAP domain-containing protein n=1 Tax=Stephania japonica TaxID=461633 RepID=A0AAP0EBE0_9MAGN
MASSGSGGGGASKYLTDLPSRGLFSSTVLSSNPKAESGSKDVKGKATTENAKGKRAAEIPIDGRVSAKKVNTVSNPRTAFQDGSSSRTPQKDFQLLTVERLRSILKERGMPTKGRKDELVARLRADKGAREAQRKEE